VKRMASVTGDKMPARESGALSIYGARVGRCHEVSRREMASRVSTNGERYTQATGVGQGDSTVLNGGRTRLQRMSMSGACTIREQALCATRLNPTRPVGGGVVIIKWCVNGRNAASK